MLAAASSALCWDAWGGVNAKLSAPSPPPWPRCSSCPMGTVGVRDLSLRGAGEAGMKITWDAVGVGGSPCSA
eukprot:594563-Pyramimonas_sp.AAC.1